MRRFAGPVVFLLALYLHPRLMLAAVPTWEEQFTRAQSLQHSGKADEADELFHTALGELEVAAVDQPRDARIRFFLGKCHYELGESEKADADLNQAILLAPREAEYYFTKGLIQRFGLHSGGAVYFARATELAPGKAEYWRELGGSLADEHPDRAIAAYRKAFNLSTRDLKTLLDLGQLLTRQTDGKAQAEGIAMLKQAAAVAPADANPHVCLATAYRAQWKKDLAAEEYRAAIKLEPNDFYVRDMLIGLEREMGKSREADADKLELLRLARAGKLRVDSYPRERFQSGEHDCAVVEYFAVGSGQPWLRFSDIDAAQHEPRYEVVAIKEEAGAYRLEGAPLHGKTQVFARYAKEPAYDEVKKKVVEIISGGAKPLVAIPATAVK